jgi:hypothetical protein
VALYSIVTVGSKTFHTVRFGAAEEVPRFQNTASGPTPLGTLAGDEKYAIGSTDTV